MIMSTRKRSAPEKKQRAALLNGTDLDKVEPPDVVVQWVHDNDAALRELFPKEWTKIDQLDIKKIDDGMRALGGACSDAQHLAHCISALVNLGIAEEENDHLRRIPVKKAFKS